MSIWKCAGGGYRSGGTDYEEYVKIIQRVFAKREPMPEADYYEENRTRDIQLLRKAPIDEIYEEIRKFTHRVDRDDIAAVLEALENLTPDGRDKEAWAKIHEA